jgi:AcrR family transcriptional regulator
MGRIKKFSRDVVLERAIPLFWNRGFAHVGVADLEKATGVNKSGLYAEFKSKDELFTACLEYYFDHREWRSLLSVEPLGWTNIERFLHSAYATPSGQSGCLAINTLRDLSFLSEAASGVFAKNSVILRSLVTRNIAAAQTSFPSEILADVVMTFFYGLGIERNVEESSVAFCQKVDGFMKLLV